jgi:hypothetical protein
MRGSKYPTGWKGNKEEGRAEYTHLLCEGNITLSSALSSLDLSKSSSSDDKKRWSEVIVIILVDMG